MAPTARPDSLSTPMHLPRRTLVAAGAWSVPVVAAATAAPAYAASTCAPGAVRAVTWSANTNSGTTQAGTVTGNTLNVTSSYTGSAGSRSATRNMVRYTVSTANDSFELSNNIPPTTTPVFADNYQTATFTFTNRVGSVTFTIEDIDSTTGASGFYDRVAIIPGPGATSGGAKRTPTVLDGTGILTDPWRTNTNNNAGGYVPTQSIDATITGDFKTFQIRYWTSVGASSNNPPNQPDSSQMWIRIRGMQVKNCA